MTHTCTHCRGGTVKGNGYNYGDHRCGDCEGTGVVSNCEECGDSIAGDHELCHECEDALIEQD